MITFTIWRGAALIKDEKHFDRFDIVFSNYLEGNEFTIEKILESIPQEWLDNPEHLQLSKEERINRVLRGTRKTFGRVQKKT